MTALTSLDGELTRQEQTASGGVIVSTLNKKPFTFILETERGLNFGTGRATCGRGANHPAGQRAVRYG